MNTPLILVILAAVAALLLLFLIRMYLQKNRRDLQKLESELRDSDKD
jgi:uncharacterized integral membrane protein